MQRLTGYTLILVEPWGSGGIHNYTLALGDAIAQTGMPVRLVTGCHAARLPDDATVSQIAVLEDFFAKPRGRGVFRRAWSLGQHLANRRRLLRAIEEVVRPVVHIQWPLTKLDAGLVAAIARKYPLVVTAHNAAPHDCEDDPRVLAFWRRIFGAADAIVCHSEQTSFRLAGLYGEGIGNRAAVIPHGVGVPSWETRSLPDRESARHALGLGAGRHILFFGAIRPYKGLDVLIEAWPQVVMRVPDAVLLIAGSGATWAELQPRIIELGVQDSVDARIGWVADDKIPAFMRAAEVAVLPYRSIDGSGIVAAAAYYGLPMVLSDIVGFRAIMKEEEALFADLDPAAIADAIVALLDEPHRAAEFAANARANCLNSSSWDTCAQKHLEIYARVTEARQ